MATGAASAVQPLRGSTLLPTPLRSLHPPPFHPRISATAHKSPPTALHVRRTCISASRRRLIKCSAGDVTTTEAETAPVSASPIPPIVESDGASEGGGEESNWVAVIPVAALPRGERRLIKQDEDIILLLWYKDEVFAIENTSPAEGAYSEGLINAKLTPDGCIVCPSTDSTFDLRTGEIRDWFPTNPVLRVLTPPVRELITYPVKLESGFILIDTQQKSTGESAEIVFGGQVQAGKTASNVDVDEVRMVIDENEEGFGFTPRNEIINGRAAMVGFSLLLIFELVTGKGFLKGIGFLDFLSRYIKVGA